MQYIFGLLVGVIFMLPFAVLGIYTGQLVDTVKSRKNMYGMASILWSSTTLIQASFPNIIVFSIMRFTLAVFQSTGNPLMYSLLRDYFPPSKRVMTTSIVGSTINLGVALSSLSLIIIDYFGWRTSYYVTASYGIIIGIVGILVLREPARGQYDKKKNQEEEAAEPELAQLKNKKKENFFHKLLGSFLGIIR
jgi:MFS family permease